MNNKSTAPVATCAGNGHLHSDLASLLQMSKEAKGRAEPIQLEVLFSRGHCRAARVVVASSGHEGAREASFGVTVARPRTPPGRSNARRGAWSVRERVVG